MGGGGGGGGGGDGDGRCEGRIMRKKEKKRYEKKGT